MHVRSYRVSVAKDYLSFSSAHFITFRGHKCESLHGHNYRLAVVVEGDVDAECLFVLDFAVLKQLIKPMVERSAAQGAEATAQPAAAEAPRR